MQQAHLAWTLLTISIGLAAPVRPTGCAQAPAGGPSSVPGPPPTQAADEGLIASEEPGWPQWRGPRRDGVSDQKGLLAQWPDAGPPLLWKTGNLGRGWSSPIIVANRIFITGDVADQLVIFALDLDGRLQWRSANGRAWKGPYPGARATCAFSEGRLYHMNAHGRVACLHATSGQELWALDVLEQFQGQNITWGMSECLLVDGPRLIVTPGGRKALLAALDKNTGKTLWATKPLAGDQATYASPILFRYAGRRILAGCSARHGFGVDADSGKLLWTVPLRNQYDVNASMPVYGAGAIHYATAYFTGGCYRLRPLGPETQLDLAWSTPLDCVTGSGVLVDGLLYASGYRKFKSWIALDWQSGTTRAELKDLTTGAAIYADRRLYCLAEDGRVALVSPASEGFRIMGQLRLVPKRVNDAWAHPVLLDGRLYLRYHDTLWCYDVRGG
ncbi:MAG: outer membrane protein assembly factor BamB family protein [Thermoguttaceae bacterium]